MIDQTSALTQRLDQPVRMSTSSRTSLTHRSRWEERATTRASIRARTTSMCKEALPLISHSKLTRAIILWRSAVLTIKGTVWRRRALRVQLASRGPTCRWRELALQMNRVATLIIILPTQAPAFLANRMSPLQTEASNRMSINNSRSWPRNNRSCLWKRYNRISSSKHNN